MADLRRAVREWAQQRGVSEGSLYLVALSGGSDSLALAWALALEAPGLGIRAGAVIVDHQLQPHSAEVARASADQASDVGLAPVMIKTVTVGVDGGPEEAARQARYQAFSESVRETGASGILLGHTRDDQAETMLLGLTRGSGPSGLKGMAPSNGSLHRPLLGLTRQSLQSALVDAGLTWWDDPHNDDESFTRVVVRKSVVPYLEEKLGPGVAASLARTAQLFRDDSEALDSLAETFFDSAVTIHTLTHQSLEVASLEQQQPAIASRALRRLVMSVGGGAPAYAQMQQVLGLLQRWSGQSALDLSGASLERKDGHIHAHQSQAVQRKGART